MAAVTPPATQLLKRAQLTVEMQSPIALATRQRLGRRLWLTSAVPTETAIPTETAVSCHAASHLCPPSPPVLLPQLRERCPRPCPWSTLVVQAAGPMSPPQRSLPSLPPALPGHLLRGPFLPLPFILLTNVLVVFVSIRHCNSVRPETLSVLFTAEFPTLRMELSAE